MRVDRVPASAAVPGAASLVEPHLALSTVAIFLVHNLIPSFYSRQPPLNRLPDRVQARKHHQPEDEEAELVEETHGSHATYFGVIP